MQDQSSPADYSGSVSTSSSSSALQTEDSKEGMESDDETGMRVPEFGLALPGQAPAPAPESTSGRAIQATAGSTAAAGTSSERAQSSSAAQATASSAHRRGRSPAPDKEHRRLKRLLRNRVSAQQARERKKAYVSELEVRVKDLERSNSELEERLSTLQNENQMLRQVLKNTTVNRRGPNSSAGGDSK